MNFCFIAHHYETVTQTMSVFTLPRLTAIIKSFLSSVLLLLVDSMRHSSSAPVCSYYCTLLPFLLAPVFYSSFFFLFLCCSCVTGSIVVIINSKQPWPFTFLSDACCIRSSHIVKDISHIIKTK